MESPTTEPKVARLFSIQVGDETRDVTGRKEAVELAKQLSEEHRTATLQRDDGRVQMQFREGELESYAYLTRGKG